MRRLSPMLVLAGGLLSGCVYDHYDHYDHYHYGTVTLAWSIAGVADPSACAAHGASLVRITIFADHDGLVLDQLVPCTTSAATYSLHAGWYAATLTLLDPSRTPVSAPEDTGGFYVDAGYDTFVTVRFAAPAIPLSSDRPPAMDAGSDAAP